jgi:hypothetical protein
LRIMRLGADYALSDVWLGADRSAINALSLQTSEGMKKLHCVTTGGGADPAAPGRADRLYQDQLRDEPHTNPVRAMGRRDRGLMGLLTGQWSPNILPLAEQFYLGGSRVARRARLLCRPGAGRQDAGSERWRRTSASRRRCSNRRSTSRPSTTYSAIGARLGRI